MLVTSTMDSSSLGELCPSPIKATDDSIQTITHQIGSSSLLMHSSFAVHRHHSDDITNASFSTTTTFRPRRSISSSSGQPQTRHIPCPMNNYSHSVADPSERLEHQDIDEPIRDQVDLNGTQNEEGDSFEGDDDDENNNELNLAVVVGNEDIQSLKGFTTEQSNNDHGTLDVAFIDETDVERQLQQNAAVEMEMVACESADITDGMIVEQEELNEQPASKQIAVLREKSFNQEDMSQQQDEPMESLVEFEVSS
jgi:hypothetical protein